MAKRSGKVTRFLVFRFVKKFHAEMGRVPTGSEMSVELGISTTSALGHMSALHGADGMPKFSKGTLRASDDVMPHAEAHALGRISRGLDFDYNSVPVDRLIIT